MTARVRGALAAAMMTAMVVLLTSFPAQAADSPEGAVHDLLDALEAESFDDFDDFVCEERQAAIRDRFDVVTVLPEGVDPETIAGAVDLLITERTVELVEETGGRAEVRVGGQLRALIDAAYVRELAKLSLGFFGAEVEPEQIDELAQQLSEQLAAAHRSPTS